MAAVVRSADQIIIDWAVAHDQMINIIHAVDVDQDTTQVLYRNHFGELRLAQYYRPKQEFTEIVLPESMVFAITSYLKHQVWYQELSMSNLIYEMQRTDDFGIRAELHDAFVKMSVDLWDMDAQLGEEWWQW